VTDNVNVILCQGRYEEYWPVDEDAQDKNGERLRIEGQPAIPGLLVKLHLKLCVRGVGV